MSVTYRDHPCLAEQSDTIALMDLRVAQELEALLRHADDNGQLDDASAAALYPRLAQLPARPLWNDPVVAASAQALSARPGGTDPLHRQPVDDAIDQIAAACSLTADPALQQYHHHRAAERFARALAKDRPRSCDALNQLRGKAFSELLRAWAHEKAAWHLDFERAVITHVPMSWMVELVGEKRIEVLLSKLQRRQITVRTAAPWMLAVSLARADELGRTQEALADALKERVLQTAEDWKLVRAGTGRRPAQSSGVRSARNYSAMGDAKLLGCLQDLRAGAGDAVRRCQRGGGDPGADLQVVEQLAVQRGLI